MPLVQVFFLAVALAVSAVPEGLPVAITVALSIASGRMAARHVIVRALPAVEGLGACTMIASDKTGTLTCNELMISRVDLLADGTVGPGFRRGICAARCELRWTKRHWTPQPRRRSTRLASAGVLCNEATLREDRRGPCIWAIPSMSPSSGAGREAWGSTGST